jgi:6-phosphogluconolactonase (cycloisomerase 2 family)
MCPIQIRSSVGWLSVVLFSAVISFAGCGGGGGSGGRGGDAAVGTGGKATGGSGGGSAYADAGPDAAAGSGGVGGGAAGAGAGGVGVDGSAGTGGTASLDANLDVPAGTGGGRAEAGDTGGLDGQGVVDSSAGTEVSAKDGAATGTEVSAKDGAATGTEVSAKDGAAPALLHLYVGCADTTGTIQTYSLNSATAAITPLSTFVAGGAISNSAFNDSEDRFYVAHVIGSGAMLTTYSRNATTGALTSMGTPVPVPYSPPGSGGGVDGGIDGSAPATNAGPQTLTFDRGRHFVAVPNYYSGYVYIYGLAADGTVGSLVSWDSAGSNAHNAAFTLNNNFVLVPYLGSNLIEVYAFNGGTGTVTPVGSTTLPAANSGPRHLALHANGKWLYSINETAGGATSPAGTIDFFKVDQTAGTVVSSATFSVPLPAGYTGAKNGGEIEIAPSGSVLYVSMRLDSVAQGSIVAYSIDATTGALTVIEQDSSRGITPRQFSLSEDGQVLVVGNQTSNTIAWFRVDPASGALTFVNTRDVCASPRFARMALVK